MSILDRSSSVAEIVLEHPGCAKVFFDHRIDFCCRGERTVEAACAERGLDVETLMSELRAAIAERKESVEVDPRTMATPALVSYILARHHAYLDRALPFLETLATKVARVHGKENPKLLALRDAFSELVASLEPHLREEEGVLFPALTADRRDDHVIAAELSRMHEEHLHVGALLERIRSLADGFAAPEWACRSYRTLMSELAVLEMDTLHHVHLENHVLMPRFKAQRAASAQAAP